MGVCGELQELGRDVLWHGKLHDGGVATELLPVGLLWLVTTVVCYSEFHRNFGDIMEKVKNYKQVPVE